MDDSEYPSPSETPTPEEQAAFEAHDTWQRRTIRRYGWALQSVLGDEESPPFVYSVGLTGWGHPELVMFAAGANTAARALNDLGELVRSGRRLVPGDRVRLPQGVVSLLAFPDSQDWLYGANDLDRAPGEPPVPALIVLPDDGFEEAGGPEPRCSCC